MSNFSQVITEFFDNITLPLLIVALGLLLIAYLNRHSIRRTWLNFRTRYCLNHLGLQQINRIRCPDGLGSEFIIDRVLLHSDGISLLMTRQYPGRIYCADHIDDWTQMLGRKSFRFNNPLFELDYQIKAMAECLPNVPIDGYLFFDHQSEFPRGHPARVIYPGNIPPALRRGRQQSVDPSVLQAWEQLQRMSQH